MTTRQVFVAGGTGYIGRRLVPALLARGHRVRALARTGAATRLAAGCEMVVGDALDARTFASLVAPCDTFVQLVGTPKPSPAKAAEFERVDWASVRASVEAARAGRVRHFVYLSVAQPAPVMRAYVEVRARGETLIRERLVDAGASAATFLRPWYVLGPGHWWPVALVPLYALLAVAPATRESARRLGLVTLRRMVDAIVRAIEEAPAGVRVVDVPTIRATRLEAPRAAAVCASRGGGRAVRIRSDGIAPPDGPRLRAPMSRLLNYFFRGLVLIAPIGVTVYVFYVLFTTIDGWLGLPVPGLGFLLTIGLITVAGFLASTFVTKGLFTVFERVLERLPFVRLVYGSTRDLLDAFVGEKRRFDRPVMVRLSPGSEARAIGFVTQPSLARLGLDGYVAVYLPFSYSVAGHVLAVPATDVAPIDAGSADVMAFLVSGGVTVVPTRAP